MTSTLKLREIQARSGWGAEVSARERLPHFMDGPDAMPALLGAMKLAIVGCGSVGGRIASALARLGVRLLILIDPKLLKAQSHLTHESVPQDAGRTKVSVFGERVKQINPSTRVLTFQGAVSEVPMETWVGLDVIFLATDNLPAEVEAGEIATLHSIPLIHGSLHGDSLTTQVRTFRNSSADSPCPACGFGIAELEQLDQRTRFSCESAGEPTPTAQVVAEATQATSSQCSLAADLAVNQFLRLVLPLGKPVGDTLLTHNGYTHQSVVSSLSRNPECRCVHQHCRVVQVAEPLEDLSIEGMLSRAGLMLEQDTALIGLDGFQWIESGACNCSGLVPVKRFLSRSGALRRRCRACGTAIKPGAFDAQRVVSAGPLGDAARIPVKRLGGRGVRSVLVRAAHEAVLLQHLKPSQEVSE